MSESTPAQTQAQPYRRSVISKSIQNPGRAAAEQRREYFATAFRRVVALYVEALEHQCPFGYSTTATLDPGIRRMNRRDVQDTLLDVEAAVRAALKNDRKTLQDFHEWYLAPELEPNTSLTKLDHAGREMNHEIEQACGREFVRRGIFPLSKYFGLPQGK